MKIYRDITTNKIITGFKNVEQAYQVALYYGIEKSSSVDFKSIKDNLYDMYYRAVQKKSSFAMRIRNNIFQAYADLEFYSRDMNYSDTAIIQISELLKMPKIKVGRL